MNYKSLRDMSRKELENGLHEELLEAAKYNLFHPATDGGGPIPNPAVYESELARRETIRLAKWMTVAVACNAAFIAVDIVLRWVFRS